MKNLLAFTPQAPEWNVDWAGIDHEYPWIRALAECPQDPEFHAEGSVWIHTRMVCESLAGMPEWRILSKEARETLFAAAVMHDVGKPAVTRQEEGRLASRGHSRRGSVMARTLLWEMGISFVQREAIASLVRSHQVPFFLLERPDQEKLLFRMSLTLRCDHLAMLSRADAIGRMAADKHKLQQRIDLFEELAMEHGCLEGPRRFPSDHSRFLYFRKEMRDPEYLAYDDTTFTAILMSGLPGSGKDRWIQKHMPGWPVVSLDDLREAMGIAPDENQGEIVIGAREKAREYLRARRNFIWNATNLSAHMRRQSIDLFAAYSARIRIVYVDAEMGRLFKQNEERVKPVPRKVIENLLDRWEPPDLSEAHEVDYPTEAGT